MTTDVTVIGLGPMGLALADLMLQAGKSLMVWNRSADKAAPLLARGAMLAATPAEAISASPAVMVIVYDYAAAETVLASDGVSAALRDRLLINLGTGGPDETRRLAAEVERQGARYLDCAIQAAPSQMGKADTPVLLSGAKAAYDEALPLLRIIAGNPVYLGEKIEAAAYMDLATLSYVYGAFAGFLHGAQIAEATGIDVATYGNLVHAISPSFGEFFKHEGNVIASGDFRISESPLRISVPAVARILATSQRLGLNVELPALVDGWLQKAAASGLADKELAALIEVVRTTARRQAA